MKNGIYAVKFATPRGSGTGVAVIRDNKYHGGDNGYWYRGSFDVNSNAVQGKLHIENHTPHVQSVFGSINQLDLDIAGTAQDTSFSVTGNAAGQAIQISARYVTDLI